MKLAVVGSRNWAMRIIVYKELDAIYPSEIVSGGAEGPDKVAEAWAYVHLVPCRVFRPDWSVGRQGAAIRNRQIVDYCDQLIAFWDGKSRGTKMTIDMAERAGKLMRVVLE